MAFRVTRTAGTAPTRSPTTPMANAKAEPVQRPLRALRICSSPTPPRVSLHAPSLPPQKIVTLRQVRSALRPLSPPYLTLLLLAAWLGGCAADGSPPLSLPSPSSPPALPSPSTPPPLSPPPLAPAWDISVSGGDYVALGSPTALTYILQGTTASGAPYYQAESDDGDLYYLYWDPSFRTLCDDGNREARWIIGSLAPSTTALINLVGVPCFYWGYFNSNDSSLPPQGPATWYFWAPAATRSGNDLVTLVTISQLAPPPSPPPAPPLLPPLPPLSPYPPARPPAPPLLPSPPALPPVPPGPPPLPPLLPYSATVSVEWMTSPPGLL